MREHEAPHPLEAARNDLDDALPLMTDDPTSTTSTLVERSPDREPLGQLTDDQLLLRSAREVERATLMVARLMMVRPTLVVTKPSEVSLVLRALARCLEAASPILAKSLEQG
jgi:hypothetical protein